MWARARAASKMEGLHRTARAASCRLQARTPTRAVDANMAMKGRSKPVVRHALKGLGRTVRNELFLTRRGARASVFLPERILRRLRHSHPSQGCAALEHAWLESAGTWDKDATATRPRTRAQRCEWQGQSLSAVVPASGVRPVRWARKRASGGVGAPAPCWDSVCA